jgi:allantoate deiminase
MQQVHDLLRHWMSEAGMDVRVDDAGNLVGRLQSLRALPPRSGVGVRTLLIGSHLDTVPNAGAFDGILGVLIGLAVAESFKDQPLPFAIDVIGFSEEEGVRYAQPYLGSHAIAGSFDSSWLTRVDEAGVTMADAMIEFGLNPNGIPHAVIEPEQVIGFVETHIEQGPVLAGLEKPVGVVTSIVGQSRLVVSFEGEAGHAGTVPMTPRRDALVGASKWIQQVRKTGCSDDGLRATVGRVLVSPNASNVIPARVELSLDVRHASDEVRMSAVDDLIAAGNWFASEDDLQFAILQRSDSSSVAASPRLETLLADAVAKQGIDVVRLASGAGHDAVVMAKRFPMSMLFIRHPGGISHHPDERVDGEDVAVAIEVLKEFIMQLAVQEQEITT